MTKENIKDDFEIGRRLGDLSNIPPEMLKEIKPFSLDELEMQILDVIANDFGGIAGIDEIFLQIFRKYGRQLKRPFLASKMNRMNKKRLILSKKGKRGIYMISKKEIIRDEN